MTDDHLVSNFESFAVEQAGYAGRDGENPIHFARQFQTQHMRPILDNLEAQLPRFDNDPSDVRYRTFVEWVLSEPNMALERSTRPDGALLPEGAPRRPLDAPEAPSELGDRIALNEYQLNRAHNQADQPASGTSTDDPSTTPLQHEIEAGHHLMQWRYLPDRDSGPHQRPGLTRSSGEEGGSGRQHNEQVRHQQRQMFGESGLPDDLNALIAEITGQEGQGTSSHESIPDTPANDAPWRAQILEDQGSRQNLQDAFLRRLFASEAGQIAARGMQDHLGDGTRDFAMQFHHDADDNAAGRWTNRRDSVGNESSELMLNTASSSARTPEQLVADLASTFVHEARHQQVAHLELDKAHGRTAYIRSYVMHEARCFAAEAVFHLEVMQTAHEEGNYRIFEAHEGLLLTRPTLVAYMNARHAASGPGGAGDAAHEAGVRAIYEVIQARYAPSAETSWDRLVTSREVAADNDGPATRRPPDDANAPSGDATPPTGESSGETVPHQLVPRGEDAAGHVDGDTALLLLEWDHTNPPRVGDTTTQVFPFDIGTWVDASTGESVPTDAVRFRYTAEGIETEPLAPSSAVEFASVHGSPTGPIADAAPAHVDATPTQASDALFRDSGEFKNAQIETWYQDAIHPHDSRAPSGRARAAPFAGSRLEWARTQRNGAAAALLLQRHGRDWRGTGESAQLRGEHGGVRALDRAAGFAKPPGHDAHHIIPIRELRDHPLYREMRRRGLLNANDPSNLIWLPGTDAARQDYVHPVFGPLSGLPLHASNHSVSSDEVSDLITSWMQQHGEQAGRSFTEFTDTDSIQLHSDLIHEVLTTDILGASENQDGDNELH